MTAAGAAVMAFVGTTLKRVPSPQLQADTAGIAEVVPAADQAPAFPPQPRDDQVTYLKELVDELREENQKLGTVDDQVAALRQDLADQRAERQYEAEEEAAHQDAVLQVLDMLRHDEDTLATGDTDGVAADLAYAEALLTGNALYEVQAARDALSREDLYPAREHLATAIALGSSAQ